MKNPLLRFWGLIAVLMAFALSACAFSEPQREAVSRVPGPDGEDALLISCDGDASHCARMAGNLCPAGYELHGMGQAQPPALVSSGKVVRRVPGTPGFMFVTCTEDPSVARAERARARCDDAYASSESFAAYWTARRNRNDRRASYPSIIEFETACRTLTARVQRCMRTRYREAHGEACDAALGELATGDAEKIDGLFFE